MRDARLKPCPFCGSESIFILSKDMIRGNLASSGRPAFGLVACDKCTASVRTRYATDGSLEKLLETVPHQLYEESIQIWNTRAGEGETEQ